MADEGDFLFGLKFDFDGSGFMRGSEEAQEQLERTLAAIIHTQRAAGESVEALARSLSASPQEVKKALAELERVERDQQRQHDRAMQDQARKQAAAHRNEMAMLRERQQGVNTLRDALLSVAAISIGGAGLAGINSLLQDTSMRGISERNFAERTGTSMRGNIAEEEGAYLSGLSSREEARQSIGAYSQSRAEYLRTGRSSVTDALIRSGVQIDPSFFSQGHEAALNNVVRQLRGLGYNNQMVATILEQSGLTSGGYTNLALNPEMMHRYNQRGAVRANEISANEARDEAFQRQWRDMQEHISTLRDDIAHTLEPWVQELDGFVVKLDELVKKNPDLARQVVEATAVVVALGGLFGAILPMITTIMALSKIAGIGGAPTAASAAPEILSSLAPSLTEAIPMLFENPLAAAAIIAGGSIYDAGSEIAYDSSEQGRIEGNQARMRDRYYGAFRYGSLEQSERQYSLEQYLISNKGYSREQAAAVAAMARAEGGFNTQAVGDNGTAEGTFQHHVDRRRAIESHFGKRLTSMTLNEQADALDWELHNGESKAGRAFFAARDLHGTVKAALDAERPAEYLRNGVGGSEYQRRYAMALRAMQQTQGQVPVAPGSSQTIHIGSMTVQANDAQHFKNSMQRASMTPNPHAAMANTGQH